MPKRRIFDKRLWKLNIRSWILFYQMMFFYKINRDKAYLKVEELIALTEEADKIEEEYRAV